MERPSWPAPEKSRLEEIHANLIVRLVEAEQQGWLGGVAAIEATFAAAEQKLQAMREVAVRTSTVALGMSGIRKPAGRSTDASPLPTAVTGSAQRPLLFLDVDGRLIAGGTPSQQYPTYWTASSPRAAANPGVP
ncbi:hypothetical protein [Nonomuraea sp. NPDC049695]|uniref:hypothetical protein n=1 Tax=Nonomuraea sp. NPDC049695 TaxID=3154734 RepID=UPI00341F6A93